MAPETVTIDFNATLFPLGLDSVARFGGSAGAVLEEAASDLLQAAPKRPIDDEDEFDDDEEDEDDEDEEEDEDDLEDDEDDDEEEDEDDEYEDDDEEDEDDEDDDEEEEDEDVDELRVSSRR